MYYFLPHVVIKLRCSFSCSSFSKRYGDPRFPLPHLFVNIVSFHGSVYPQNMGKRIHKLLTLLFLSTCHIHWYVSVTLEMALK